MDSHDSRQIEHEAAAWLARRDSSAWTERDEAGLAAWIEASTAHRVAFLRLEATWAACGRLRALGAGVRSGTVPRRSQWSGLPSTRDATPDHPGSPRTVARRFRTAWAGAALAVLVVGGTLAWGWRVYFASGETSYETVAGEMRTVALADGSSATLSSGSAIDVRLGYRDRRIGLRRGEAFFSVAHDTRRPFLVIAGGRRAVAVGTRFAVRRDPDETRIVVTEGVVRLEALAPRDGSPVPSALLTAGSIATAHGSNVLVRAGSMADAERILSWRSGYLTFHDTSLETAVAEFNRYGSQRLVIGDAAIGLVRIGGNFRWSNSEAFVRLLESGFNIRVERLPDRIVLHSR